VNYTALPLTRQFMVQRGRSIAGSGPAAQVFLDGLVLLVGESAQFGRFRLSRRDAPFRRVFGRGQHATQLFQAILDVARLIAKSLTGEDEFTVLIDPPGKLLPKPSFDVVGDAARSVKRPSEDGFGVDLIDVLATRSRGAREGQANFVVGDLDSG
jgi:hypothetical protein